MPVSTTPVIPKLINIAGAGDNTVIAAVAGQIIRVYKILLWANGSTSVTLKDGAATSLTGAMAFTAQTGFVLDYDDQPWFITSSGNAFVINLSAAIQVSGTLSFTQS